jgi:hypothetical protein
MLRTRTLAVISLITGALSMLCLLLVMAALQDIYYGIEHSLTAEWTTVKIGLPLLLFFHFISLAGTINMLRKRGKSN